MSDALNYLLSARGDAVKPYFKFLKEAGKHLDPKTRDLISVITKVHSQTEGGFRQYLARALRNGCTADEVLDALLMGFPALGFAKIVWAVDIILDMDIPEFQTQMLGSEGKWHELINESEVPLGEVKYIDCEGRNLFIYRSETETKVYDSRCPHQVTNIPNLACEGDKLTCPKHNWVFDIKTGECIEKGSHPLKQFDTKVENSKLWAYW
ncbi:MAG: Rieske 2Fe-2S domain-containing protein [SAR324 cluster bacterium]|nr:Rieske 2Fe-2S domain-containing protein [SAR324 cluster bacterium]